MEKGEMQSLQVVVYLRNGRKRLHYCMRKITCACILFFFVSGEAHSQQHLVDSITKLLQQPLPDTSRAISMMRLAIDYEVVDTARAYQAYRDAIEFGVEKKLYYQLGRIYQNQSVLFSTAARYTEAIASMDTAIVFYKKVDTFRAKRYEAIAHGDKANYFRNHNELQLAIESYLISISLLEQLRLDQDLAVRYGNVSLLFGDIGEFVKQKEYAHKGLVFANRGSSAIGPQMAYTILAYTYSMQNDNISAKAYLDSGKVSFNEYSNVDFITTYYLIAAQIYKNMGQLDSSFYFFDQCLKASEKYNHSYGKAESQIQMGAILILQKEYGDAEKFLLAGVQEAKAMNSFKILDNGYKYLSDIYAVTGRYELAYDFFQKHKEVSDTLITMDLRRNVTELEKKYETEKKSRQILLQEAQLQKGRILNFIVLGSASIILLISLFSYRTYRQKQKLHQQRIAELETEKQLSATEAVLKGEEQERSRLAKDLHDGLGGMLSGIKYSLNNMKGNLIMTPGNAQAFERSIDMLDSSIREMRRVAHNMMPEALVKFGLDTALRDYCHDINQSGALKVTYQSIGIDSTVIDQTTAITLYRIVQELVTNTLKHAAAKTAIVQVTRTNNVLTVTVEDDGKGFDSGILKQSRGIGWSNIQNRVEFLKGKLDVNSQHGQGTSVLIEVRV